MRTADTKRPKARTAAISTPERVARELTPLQTQVAELASDLIMNGGHVDDVNGLLHAVLAHSWRRMFPDHPRDREEREKAVTRHVERNQAEWFKRLAGYWPRNPVRRKDEPLPKTVTEMARANVRGLLWDRFEEFMGDVEDLGDVVMLSDTLCAFINGNRPLPEAFARQIDRSGVYIKIPESDADTVQKVLEKYLLMKDRIAELEAFARRVKLITPELGAA